MHIRVSTDQLGLRCCDTLYTHADGGGERIRVIFEEFHLELSPRERETGEQASRSAPSGVYCRLHKAFVEHSFSLPLLFVTVLRVSAASLRQK